MATYLISEDTPNQTLSLHDKEEHLTFDRINQKISIEQHSLLGLRKKKLEIPFSRLQEIELKSEQKAGQDADLSFNIKYQDETGASKDTSLSLRVKDLNHRAEVMDLLFRMARTTSAAGDGAFRDGAGELSLDRYVVRQCTEDTITLSAIRSTTPESIQGRAIPQIEDPANYPSNEALQRIEAPIPGSFAPKQFLGKLRFLSWEPGKRIELLSAIAPTKQRELLYKIAKWSFFPLVLIPTLFKDWLGIDPGDGFKVLWAFALNFSFFYSVFTKFYRYVTWSPEKLLSKIVHKPGWAWVGAYLLAVVGFQTLPEPLAGISLALSGLAFLFAGTAIAANRNLDPARIIQQGGEHVVMDWEANRLASTRGSSPLSAIKEIVCSLHQETKDGQTLFFGRLEAVVEGGRLPIAETERFVNSRLEPYFAISPMGAEIANKLNIQMRSEDNTTPTPNTAPVSEQVSVPEEVEVGVSR